MVREMNVRPLISVIDDEPLLRSWLSEHLGAAGYTVNTAGTGEKGLGLVEAERPDLVLLDLRLPDANGIDLLSRIREADRDVVVVMMTAYGEIETAVRAVKAGAYDFLQKPLDIDGLLLTIEKALEAKRLRQQVAVLREHNKWRFANVEIVGRSPAMKAIMQTVEKVARTDSATVLILGESGTGKDLVARAIHAQSSRSDHPFLEVSCTALPENLFESELFGHERGAFTDAKERKKGLAELADGGTLFLDEIGDMSTGTQAKLLRFLENSRFKRVGGVTDLTVDVRVIAATNRDLEVAVESGGFRSDLYYRLKVVPIHIPPLRQRTEDIRPLVLYFVDSLSRALRRESPTVADEAMDVLTGYPWPGNVRELRNVLERVLILEDSAEITADDLPREMRHPRSVQSADQSVVGLPEQGVSMAELERDLVQQAMERSGNNVTRAAKLLGLSRDALRYRIEKYKSESNL